MTSEESGLLGEIKTEFVEDFEIQNFVPLKACDIKLEDHDKDFASFCDDKIKIEIDELNEGSPVENNIFSPKPHINNTNVELPFVEIKVELEDFVEPKDETSASEEINDTFVLGQPVKPVTASEGLSDTESIENGMIAGEGLVGVQQASLLLDSNPSVVVEQCFQNNQLSSGQGAAVFQCETCGKPLKQKHLKNL